MRQKLMIAVAFGLATLLVATASLAAPQPVRLPTDEEIQKITAAMPDKPTVKPAQPRRVLIVGRNEAHLPVPFAAKALEIMAMKTGAFEAVFSNDPSIFEPEKLAQFDAVILNNLHLYNPLLPLDFKQLSKEQQEKAKRREKRLRQSLEDYVKGGKGLVGIHGTTVGLYDWPEFGEMIGGYFSDWPWKGNSEIPIKLDDPTHPLNAAFEGKSFAVLDEGYEFKAPYSREKLRVLLSIDLGKTKELGKRPDHDYAMSWVQSYGKGRVFYCAIGHFPELYWNSNLLRHYLDGIRFAIGDLKADTTPSAKLDKQ